MEFTNGPIHELQWIRNDKVKLKHLDNPLSAKQGLTPACLGLKRNCCCCRVKILVKANSRKDTVTKRNVLQSSCKDLNKAKQGMHRTAQRTIVTHTYHRIQKCNLQQEHKP
ncbi:hypothetical protein H5410_019260 [Solanum commersonii]|uniref:Uncharacterized protein n=1 Tax=Solanum commersonii TaxID=4109 RepID=A0A9J6A5G6_SOLCO|nr:hypothetical protein H5410_019260 [Solanum commersonii]